MVVRRLEEERVNEEIRPQVEQVSQDGERSSRCSIFPSASQGDPIPNVEEGIEVP